MLPLLLKPTGSTGFTTGYGSQIGRYAAGLGIWPASRCFDCIDHLVGLLLTEASLLTFSIWLRSTKALSCV